MHSCFFQLHHIFCEHHNQKWHWPSVGSVLDQNLFSVHRAHLMQLCSDFHFEIGNKIDLTIVGDAFVHNCISYFPETFLWLKIEWCVDWWMSLLSESYLKYHNATFCFTTHWFFVYNSYDRNLEIPNGLHIRRVKTNADWFQQHKYAWCVQTLFSRKQNVNK